MTKIYEWHDKLDFGEHKGEHIDEVFQKHPEYIQSCLEETEGFRITISTCHHLEKLIDGYKFSDKARKSIINQKKYSSQPGESEFKLYPTGDPFIQPLDDIGFEDKS